MLLLASLAFADVIPEVPKGQIHVEHMLQVDDLGDHVLLALQPGADLRGYRVLTADAPLQTLGNGARPRGNLSKAHLSLMTREAYDAWQLEVSAEVARQEALCEEGIGCDHISRFTPTLEFPKAVSECGVTIDVQTRAPKGADAVRVDVYKLLDGEGCTLLTEQAPGIPTPTPGCGHVGFAPAALGLLLLGVAARRRQYEE